MSFTDRRQNSTAAEHEAGTSPLQIPELVDQQSPVEQLPFPDYSAQPAGSTPVATDQSPASPGISRPQFFAHPTTSPGVTRPLLFPTMSPGVTRSLNDPITSPGATQSLGNEASTSDGTSSTTPTTVPPVQNWPLAFPPALPTTLSTASPNVTRALPELQTGVLPITRNNTTSLRQPVVIRGTSDKEKEKGKWRPPPKGRRLVVHVAVTSVLVVIVLGTLLTAISAGSDAQTGKGFSIFQPILGIVNTKGNNTGLIASQAATATAVTQDGYDNGPASYAGLPPAPPGAYSGGLGRFTYGQCTYWANMRYHELTGVWVTWLGNADQWASGASQTPGWVVSATPHVPSIIVLQPWVQNAGPVGHVAVVERINSDGSVYTSNWNWYSNGGWAIESWVTFHPGPGVNFIWQEGH
jgi:surface antigen